MHVDDRNSLFEQVLNELIPASKDGRIPAAGDLGVAEFFTRASAYSDENPEDVVNTVLNEVGKITFEFTNLDSEARVAVLKKVETEQAAAFAELVRLTYMGYYSRADVRPLFGVAAHAVHPKGYAVSNESEVLMQELTEPVRARGDCYQSTDTKA